MHETEKRGTWLQRWAVRLCAVALVGLSCGGANAATLSPVRGFATAPAAPQGAKTAAIKAAIKVVVKALRAASKADVLAMLVRFEASPAVRRAVITHAGAIATRLESLLVWEELTLEVIKDQVVNALTRGGVGDILARDVGHYVKLAVKALL